MRVWLGLLPLVFLLHARAQTITCTPTPAATVTCSVTPVIPPVIVPPVIKGTALTACADLLKSGSFYLANDVTAAGTCFFIDAAGITLNLNGHTITYATATNSKPTPGILLADPWYTVLAKSGTTSTHGGFIVYGPGTILESPAGAVGSAGVWVGQSSGLAPAPVIHDAAITTTSADAMPIRGDISVSGWQIYNNRLTYGSKVTNSRQQMLGYAIWIANQEQAPGLIPDTIMGNSILAAPQGGIRDTHQNAKITANDITFNSYYTNDFCIDAAADGQLIDKNVCHPVSGRGLHANANSVTLSNNQITVQESSQNAEYSGCELGGAYGIQVEFDSSFTPASPTGIKLVGNTITATAGNCPAVGIRFTSLTTPVTVTGNTVITTSSGTALDYALQFSGVNLPGTAFPFTSNSFKAKHALIGSDWDGANVTVSSGNTWSTAVYTVDLQNGFKDQAESGPTFTQSITLGDSAPLTLACGTYATSAVSIGGKTLKC